MAKKKSKIIQVPVPEDLLYQLDELSHSRGESRSSLIREACVEYVASNQEAEKVRRYVDGYTEFPEGEEELEWAEFGLEELGRKYAKDEW